MACISVVVKDSDNAIMANNAPPTPRAAATMAFVVGLGPPGCRTKIVSSVPLGLCARVQLFDSGGMKGNGLAARTRMPGAKVRSDTVE